MEPSPELRKAKDALWEIVSRLPGGQVKGLGFGTLVNTIAGEGRELESPLSGVDSADPNLGFRVYLRAEPHSKAELPASYRGVRIGYVVVGEIQPADANSSS